MTRRLALLALTFWLCACSSASVRNDEAVMHALTKFSEHEIFPISDERRSELLSPIGGTRCRTDRLPDGFSITCTETTRDAAANELRTWLALFETDLDASLVAHERRNGALLSGRVEGAGDAWRSTIAFRHDPGLQGLL